MTDLSGITITTGFMPSSTRENLIKAVERIGAKIADGVRIDTTHFVTTEGRGPQWEKAVESNIPVVRPEWVEACERGGRILGVTKFYLDAMKPGPPSEERVPQHSVDRQKELPQTPAQPPQPPAPQPHNGEASKKEEETKAPEAKPEDSKTSKSDSSSGSDSAEAEQKAKAEQQAEPKVRLEDKEEQKVALRPKEDDDKDDEDEANTKATATPDAASFQEVEL